MARIAVQADGGTFFGGGAKSGQVWVRRGNLFQRQQVQLPVGFFPAQTTQHFADRHLADADAACDFPIGMALGLELVNQASVCGRQAPAPFGVPVAAAQGRQAAILKSLLVPAHRARRATEHPGHLLLAGPSLLDEMDHGVSLSHPIRRRILCQDNPGHDDQAVAILSFDHAPVVNDLSAFRVPKIGKEIVTCVSVHIRRRVSPAAKKADRFGFAPSGASKLRKKPGIPR